MSNPFETDKNNVEGVMKAAKQEWDPIVREILTQLKDARFPWCEVGGDLTGMYSEGHWYPNHAFLTIAKSYHIQVIVELLYSGRPYFKCKVVLSMASPTTMNVETQRCSLNRETLESTLRDLVQDK